MCEWASERPGLVAAAKVVAGAADDSNLSDSLRADAKAATEEVVESLYDDGPQGFTRDAIDRAWELAYLQTGYVPGPENGGAVETAVRAELILHGYGHEVGMVK